MSSDKLFYATWGFVFILAGLAAILGMLFELELFPTAMIWLIGVGILLILIGIANLKKSRSTANIQLVLGYIFALMSALILSVYLNIINPIISFIIMIILIGIIIVGMSLSKEGEIKWLILEKR